MSDDEKRLEEIETRLSKVDAWTPDDCEIKVDPDDGYIYAPQGATLGPSLITLGDTYEGSGNDWNFVAHAPEDVKWLVARVRELEAKLQAEYEQQAGESL